MSTIDTHINVRESAESAKASLEDLSDKDKLSKEQEAKKFNELMSSAKKVSGGNIKREDTSK